MKLQNELIENANKKLKDEIIDFKRRVNYGTGKFEWFTVNFYLIDSQIESHTENDSISSAISVM